MLVRYFTGTFTFLLLTSDIKPFLLNFAKYCENIAGNSRVS